MSPAEGSVPATMRAQIWDAPVRLVHWLLVVLLAFSWWSGEQHLMEWHRLSGYAILALLVFRVYWGFVGGRTARFTQFVRGPRAAFAYARSLTQRPYSATPGHNPLGGWSVLLMLATLAVMVVAGLFSVDVDGLESGPLAGFVDFDQGRVAAAVHEFVFKLLLGVVALHVLAILFYLVRLRHDLVTPMIHGRRRTGEHGRVEELGASVWMAVLGIFIAGACTYAIAQGFQF